MEPRTSLEIINSGRATFLTFGTGFFVKHRERLFFVTADHVARYSYWEEGVDVDCNTIMIPHNNIIQEKGCLGCGFSIKSSWVSYDENKEKYGMEFFPIDVSFCEILPKDLSTGFFTQELIQDNTIICKKGEYHFYFEEHDASPFKKGKQYFFGGISECRQIGMKKLNTMSRWYLSVESSRRLLRDITTVMSPEKRGGHRVAVSLLTLNKSCAVWCFLRDGR